MSYQIQYSPQMQRKYPTRKPSRKIHWNRWIVVIFLLAAGFWTKTNGIPDILIPGNPEITRLAASNLVENLREGERVEEAFAVFCQQILDGAKE